MREATGRDAKLPHGMAPCQSNPGVVGRRGGVGGGQGGQGGAPLLIIAALETGDLWI